MTWKNVDMDSLDSIAEHLSGHGFFVELTKLSGGDWMCALDNLTRVKPVPLGCAKTAMGAVQKACQDTRLERWLA